MATSFQFNHETPRTPERQRPVQAVPVTYTTSWMYFLMVLCLLVAWYFPAKILLTRIFWPPAVVHEVRNAESFVALAYEGVSSKENEVSPAQFRDHIETLKANGYVPITLEDVRGLMLRGEPVPDRAVLMTFDHGRRTSYFGTKGHMRRAGWNGVMFLWTKPIEERDAASLLWPYVRGMVRSRTWEIGGQSHLGFESVTANAAGRTGHYMTTPQWLVDEGRFERPEEFVQRVRADHEYQIDTIEKRIGVRPRAYAYPYGDFGQYQSRGSFMRRVNLGQVGHFYDLGFVSGNLAVNTRHNDPRRLNRLRVRPEWSGEDLVAFLDRSWPAETLRVEGSAADLESSWIIDWGDMAMENNRLALYATPETTGAKMWLAGSDLSRDFYARVDFRLHQGQLGLYLRASPDEESYVYLGINAAGDAWLREKQLGQQQVSWEDDRVSDLSFWLRQKHTALERFTLASTSTQMEPRDEHTLELYVRDRMLFALVDGKALFPSHIKLRGDPKHGLLGVSVWDPEPGRARVDIASMALNNQQPALAMWSQQRAYMPHVVQWIHNHSYQLTQISPPWISFSPSGQVMRSTWDEDIYRRLARIYHLQLTPRVFIDEEDWFDRLPPSLLAQQAAEREFSGVFVDLESLRNPTPMRVATWLQQSAAALREQGVELLVKLPALLERPAAIGSLLAVVPGIQIVSADDQPLTTTAGDPVESVKIERIPETARDDDLPIYYEIMALQELTEDQSASARMLTLERNGQAAFMEAEYERAIRYWREWHELDPGSSRPLMLIGDAFLRNNEPRRAIEYYDRSLDLDPGQISLAIRRVRIMEQQRMEEEAREALNLYARLFPDNAEILLTQAEFLRDRNRSSEARKMVQRVLDRDPHHVEALTLMIRMSETADERQQYLSKFMERADEPIQHYILGNTIWRHDLLSMPEAHALRAFVDRVYLEATDERTRNLYERLRLTRSVINEEFVDARLSDVWMINSGDTQPDGGVPRLRVDSGRTEVSARLLGSERLRDGFVEASIRDWQGAFWLYARRTEHQMIRFGFETPDRMHLQVWRAGRLLVNQIADAPPDIGRSSMRLRLEVRGGGVMGYVNGHPLYDAAVAMPADYWFGWYGLAAFDSRHGAARVTLDSVRAGALPVRPALLPKSPSDSQLDAALDGLRGHTGHLTDVAPHWFRIREDGEWVVDMGERERLIRLFVRYHRFRLMPIVEVQTVPEVPVRNIAARLREHRVDGVILLYETMPSDRWFESMRAQLGSDPVDVYVMVIDRVRNVAQCRPVGSAVDLFRGVDEAVPIPIFSGDLEEEGLNERIRSVPRQDPLLLLL